MLDRAVAHFDIRHGGAWMSHQTAQVTTREHLRSPHLTGGSDDTRIEHLHLHLQRTLSGIARLG